MTAPLTKAMQTALIGAEASPYVDALRFRTRHAGLLRAMEKRGLAVVIMGEWRLTSAGVTTRAELMRARCEVVAPHVAATEGARRVEIVNADVMAGLARMESDSVDCVVTSPPYWALRDYGVGGQIGLEASIEEHMARLVDVFREVRRVMKPGATLWLNYGDAYATTPNGNSHVLHDGRVRSKRDDRTFTDKPLNTIAASGLPAKSLLMLPARLAIAMQADGWILRSDIIWDKPNPMPESAGDRPTNAYEHLFLFTKAPRYYFDAFAIREGGADTEHTRSRYKYAASARTAPADDKLVNSGAQFSEHYGDGMRHPRNVWRIPTAPYSAAHFATFPPTLAERCIKAGSSERGVCADCGAPWRRVVEKEFVPQPDVSPEKATRTADQLAPTSGRAGSTRGALKLIGKRWEPGCDCDAPVRPALVLDPFGGAGTTGLVAARLGRRAALVELNPGYARMARDRIDGEWMGPDESARAFAAADASPLALWEASGADTPENQTAAKAA